jgi:hypothetical protein
MLVCSFHLMSCIGQTVTNKKKRKQKPNCAIFLCSLLLAAQWKHIKLLSLRILRVLTRDVTMGAAPLWRALIPSQKLMAGIVIGWVTMFLVGAHWSDGLLTGGDQLGRARNFEGSSTEGGGQLQKEAGGVAQQGRKLRSGGMATLGGLEDDLRSEEQRETERLLWNATILVGMAAFRDPECQVRQSMPRQPIAEQSDALY